MRKYVDACENLASREDLKIGYVGDRAKFLNFIKSNH